MDADTLRVLVRQFFVDHAGSFGLYRDSLAVEYVLNWGGFVNYSYRVRDDRRSYHLKLSTSIGDRTALRRWMTLSPLLERYHAPPVLEWIDIGPAAGLLFPFVPGDPPALHDDVVDELVPMLQQLNEDRELRPALRSRRAITAEEAYRASFHERFMEDLRGIRESRPAFVSESLLVRLEDEVEALARQIAAVPAFAEPLTKPVHGDLWLNNVLWVNRESWHVVDWDEVRIGDPAADLAALLGPTAQDVRPLKMHDRAAGVLTPAEQERLLYLGRATLLDWVIDPVSDWIDAATAPDHAHVVRAEKERVHRLALDRYMHLYG
jgi:hypothetical protein